jgi:LysM repeat protein
MADYKNIIQTMGSATVNTSPKDFQFANKSLYKFKGDGAGATASGNLARAKLRVLDSGLPITEIDFQFNPASVEISKKADYEKAKEGGFDVPVYQFVSGERSINFGELVFDTFESRENVWAKKVVQLESLLHVANNLHRPPHVMLVWGKFLQDASMGGNAQVMDSIKCIVEEIKVNYTMFLEDGTPVRAKVNLTLKEVGNKAEKASPDFAKVYIVRRGDTLQHISQQEYGTPGEWRRIAESNAIDDPLRLAPGSRLLVPPILK